MIINIVNYFVILISFLGVNITIFESGISIKEAKLTIPKIELSQYLYEKEDKRSDLDKNIIFVNDSDTPETEKGNVIIAGHSGSSSVSYFKNLYQLQVGDILYLEYSDYIYKYQVDYKYLVEKTGQVEIRRNNNIEVLTLVTCYGNDKQLIVISNRVDKIKK